MRKVLRRKMNGDGCMRRLTILIVCGMLMACSSGCRHPAAAQVDSPVSVPAVSVPTMTATTTTTTTTPTVVSTTATATTAAPVSIGNGALSQEQATRLSETLQGYAGKVSVGYFDLTGGDTYTFHEEEAYSAASLMKAPFCQYILHQASLGACDLDKELEYTEGFYSKGTGKLKNEPFGTYYSIRTLVEYAIRYSDNAALRMLRSEFGTAGFIAYAGELGISNPSAIQLITNSTITVGDALIYMREIDRFIREDAVNGKLLYQYMTATTNPMIVSAEKYPVVRKYGWATEAFHDMAIVESPRPYVLVILTDHEDGTKEDFAMFRQISAMFAEVNR